MSLRRWVMQHLEGPDVYYDGVLEDGSQPSQTCFGSLVVHEWPFHCVLVYDDANAHATLRDSDLEALKQRNAQSGILARRQVREQIRALHGCDVQFPLERKEMHLVEDGEVMVIDPRTLRPRTKIQQATVPVQIRYSHG